MPHPCRKERDSRCVQRDHLRADIGIQARRISYARKSAKADAADTDSESRPKAGA
jgi:hypothetical protein